MREFKGTKGKWEVSEDIYNNDRVCIKSNSGHNFIDCWSLLFCSEEEMRANAKLIASAPELLEALQEVANELFQAIECINGLSSAKESKTIKRAKEAINKAL